MESMYSIIFCTLRTLNFENLFSIVKYLKTYLGLSPIKIVFRFLRLYG